MKKTLVTIAVASTFGFSAGAFAGSGHEVMTPLSVNDTGEVYAQQQKSRDFRSPIVASTGSFSDPALGSEDSSYTSDASGSLSGIDQSAALDMSSDVLIVSSTPVTMETWDYYVIDMEPGSELALSDSAFDLLPSYDIVLFTVDDMTASSGVSSEEASG